MRLFRRRAPVGFGEESPSAPSRPLAELTAVGLVAIGAALVIWAYHIATRTANLGSYDPIFWAGMAFAYLAVAWRAVSGRYTVLWLGFLGLFTVLPKFLMSPDASIYYDETAHFALLHAVISSGRLFVYTPLLPIGTYYPGLQSVAAAIHWLTGLSAWDSALTLIAVEKSLLVVQVYYIARALQVPHRWAAVAGLVYATNPAFVYGFSQFSYETLAMLFLLVIIRLYVEALAAERSGGRTWGQTLLTSLLIAMLSFICVVTHHLTSLTGIALLFAGALFVKPMSGFLDRKGGRRRLFVRWAPPLTLATCFGLWVAFVARGTLAYLSPHVARPTTVFLAMVGLGHASKSAGGFRTLFSGSPAPGYERIAAIAAPGVIGVALLFAVICWLWRRRLRSNFLWSFVVVAGYLGSLPFTLTAAGDAGARRSWATTYLGVTLLPAALAVLFELDKRRPWVKRTAAAAGAAVLMLLLVGNVASGEPVDYRFPGPYEFGTDTRSVTPETLRLAQWVRVHLGPRAHVVTDRYTALPLTARADAITPLQVRGLPIGSIWYNQRPPAPSLMSAMELQGDDYLAVDVRDSLHPPVDAPLFYAGEPRTVPPQNITRLAHYPWLHLLYSSQHYRLYKINFDLYHKWYPAAARAASQSSGGPPRFRSQWQIVRYRHASPRRTRCHKARCASRSHSRRSRGSATG
jgi:hypothetical protein